MLDVEQPMLRRMRLVLLQLYRVAILVAIAWILRDHTVRLLVQSMRPLSLDEVRQVFPAANKLVEDAGPRKGWDVLGFRGEKIGYVLHTAPVSDSIVGYRGWTNTLIAFSPEMRVLGVRIRSSQDTVDHVSDVKGDPYFLKTWNGKSWDEVAGRTPEQAGIEGVSGATMTSMALAEGIVRRLRAADVAAAQPPIPFRVKARDIGLAIVVALGTVLAFTGTRGRGWMRRGFQILVMVYVGLINGDLLAQSLMVGWAQHGVPWQTAPGLVLLLAAALIIPWTSGKPLYCQHLCPHGHAQEWLARYVPKRWRISLPRGFEAGLRWLPTLTLGYVLAVVLLVLPQDLAAVEPFDAWLIRSAGWATIAIAVIGLGAACFVPMAYCHYGCPTGALLNFIRRHGPADGFGRREVAAFLLVALAWLLSRVHVTFHDWVKSPAADWL
jgi:NosR/NirI family transcriptional regulator, nitrous oxide reductase regulator